MTFLALDFVIKSSVREGSSVLDVIKDTLLEFSTVSFSAT